MLTGSELRSRYQYFSMASAYFSSGKWLIEFIIIIWRQVSVCIIVILLLAFASLTLLILCFRFPFYSPSHNLSWQWWLSSWITNSWYVICLIFWLSFALPIIINYIIQILTFISYQSHISKMMVHPHYPHSEATKSMQNRISI